LPVNWWERSPKFFLKIFDNFNVIGAIDLFGSANMAIACVDDPPRPYLGLLQNDAHVDVLSDAVDQFIMREMGRAAPPPSKFFVAEVKELVARLSPQAATEEDPEEDSEEDDDPDEE